MVQVVLAKQLLPLNGPDAPPSREKCALGIWQREGLLSLDDGFVVLRDLEEFERLAEL